MGDIGKEYGDMRFSGLAFVYYGREDVRLEKRERGKLLIDFLTGGNFGINKRYIVRSHPAWGRTGRYVAFDSDATAESQIYVVHLAELGFYEG